MTGINERINCAGTEYMVQTQDLGPHYRSIEITIYKKGLLLQRRRFDYGPLLGHPDFLNRLKKKMETLHRAALKDIKDGQFGHKK